MRLRFIPSEPDTDNAGAGIVRFPTINSRTYTPPLIVDNSCLIVKIMRHYYPVLSIAGSDSSGGAGIQADIKTISAIGCYAMTAITAITAQNTTGISAIDGISPKMVREQIESVWQDIPPLAIKTGMLYNSAIIEQVADALEAHHATNIVVDPVMLSTSGAHLISPEAVDIMKSRLFPQATLVTPNVNEAKALTGTDNLLDQALALRDAGCRNVLLKGGDSDNKDTKTDYLLLEDASKLLPLKADAVNTRNTHGTGCTLSSAIASYLSLGIGLHEAVCRAKLYVSRALQSGAKATVGHGHGPVNHLFAPRHMKYRKYYHNADHDK